MSKKMFNGDIYFFVFINDKFEFGCYEVDFKQRIIDYVCCDYEKLFCDKCDYAHIDDNGDLNIYLYFKYGD